MAIDKTADYIIVGGGIAGCVVASRLQQYTGASVLVVEAGEDVQGHPLTSNPMDCFRIHRTALDWTYLTAPQKNLSNRTIYSPAAKALGGGSAINYGTWLRGPARDYDAWAKCVDDERWSYNGLLPYFQRSEHQVSRSDSDDPAHREKSAIHVVPTSHNRSYPLREGLLAGWREVGKDQNNHAPTQSTLGVNEMWENWREGKRQIASTAYDLSKVEVLTGRVVSKVLLDHKNGRKIACGVETTTGEIFRSMKEVIICAGAYRTPQLLMLSGIGPANELTKHNIQLKVHNDFVGHQFYDHLGVCQWWRVKEPEEGVAVGGPGWMQRQGYTLGKPIDWIAFSRPPIDSIAKALKAGNDGSADDELLHPDKVHTETILTYLPAGSSESGQHIPWNGTIIASAVLGLAPVSRGSISLASPNPLDAPIIDPNFYAKEVDRVAIRHGVREVTRMLLETKAGKDIVLDEVPPEGFAPLLADSTDEEIDNRVRRIAQSFYHAGGGAVMGKVVDTDLKVRDVSGLRVVDASIIPVSIAAHYQATVYAVAELAAEIIARDSF